MSGKSPDHARLDRVVAEARRAREAREQGYRERALKIYPWICGRCAREFDRTTVHQLTVHHATTTTTTIRPTAATGSCCASIATTTSTSGRSSRRSVAVRAAGDTTAPATHRPFADLEALLKGKR